MRCILNNLKSSVFLSPKKETFVLFLFVTVVGIIISGCSDKQGDKQPEGSGCSTISIDVNTANGKAMVYAGIIVSTTGLKPSPSGETFRTLFGTATFLVVDNSVYFVVM